ncbi:MAG: hypothetical protein GY717_16220 [Rhodobacteraceae bacterium]|nr:hypothetical protein [Paracoccaceae bacterium]
MAKRDLNTPEPTRATRTNRRTGPARTDDVGEAASIHCIAGGAVAGTVMLVLTWSLQSAT